MRKQRSQQGKSTVTARLWSYAQAVKAGPYLRSVVRSLREHWLEMQQAQRRLRLMNARPGRPDRRALVLRQVAVREAELAEERFEETLDELTAVDVYCIDPARGLAWIPFREGEERAWIVLDLFAPQGLGGWRFQADPVETRRPLAGIEYDRTVATDHVFSRCAQQGNGPCFG